MLDWVSKYVGGPSTVIFIGVFITVCGTMISAAGAIWGSRQKARFDRDLAASITGGDSFCYMFIARNKPLPEGPLFGFTHVGKFPLYDIHVQVVDRDAVLKTPTTLEAMKDWAVNFGVPNLAPGQNHMPVRAWPMPDRDEVRYSIQISARNGYFSQMLLLRRVDGIWESATRVRRGAYTDGPVIYEQVFPRYRRNPSEKIDWGEK